MLCALHLRAYIGPQLSAWHWQKEVPRPIAGNTKDSLPGDQQGEDIQAPQKAGQEGMNSPI